MIKYDLCKKVKKLEFYSPILDVLDWNMISEASGSQWNMNYALNQPKKWFSVLNFWQEFQVLVMV